MKLFKLLYWFGLIVQIAMCEKSAQEIVQEIRSLLHDLNEPFQITALVCWDIEFSVQFVKQFQNWSPIVRDYMLKVENVDTSGVPHTNNDNNELIIVDLACNGTKKLMVVYYILFLKQKLNVNYS